MKKENLPELTAQLPPRNEFVIRNATVLTMDEALGDFDIADVHVKDGEIVAIGRKLAVSVPQEINGEQAIVMPGFIDTHWHLWNGLFRGLLHHFRPDLGYFPMKALLAKLFTPNDIYWAVQRALAEAINGGITTVHNWAHNIHSPAHADANISSQIAAGVRGRFSYGWAEGQDEAEPLNLVDLERVKKEWFEGEDHLLDLGICVRGPETPRPEVRRDAYLQEFAAARRLGLPITMHAAQMRAAKSRAIELLAEDNLLGPDLQLVHCIHATADDRRKMGASGTKLSISPLIEMQVGMGFPQVGEMLSEGVLVSLSTDTVAAAGANMFAIMKSTLDVERGRTESTKFTEQKVLEMATIDGARDLGIEDKVGSLVPGKRADLIMIKLDTSACSTLHSANWRSLLINHVQPANVDLVVVDGRILKRDGKLTSVDEAHITQQARAAAKDLMVRGELLPPT